MASASKSIVRSVVNIFQNDDPEEFFRGYDYGYSSPDKQPANLMIGNAVFDSGMFEGWADAIQDLPDRYNNQQ